MFKFINNFKFYGFSAIHRNDYVDSAKVRIDRCDSDISRMVVSIADKHHQITAISLPIIDETEYEIVADWGLRSID